MVAGLLLLGAGVNAESRLVCQSGHAHRCVWGDLLGKATLKVSVLFKDFTAAL